MGTMTAYKRHTINSSGVNLAVIDEGPRDGTPIILLHGFPDSADMWRHQIPVLVDAGYRVVAPDLRGLGESDKPQDPQDYTLRKVMNDIVAISGELGFTKSHIVGHDFGAAVAWMYSFFMPRRVERLVVLSVGHPGMFVVPTLSQREKSWYMLLYQFPGISEKLLRRNSWRLLKQILGNEGDYERYLADLARPGALTAGLNWYRANNNPANELESRATFPPVLAPTMGIWSSGDKAMAEETMTGSSKFVTGPWRYERIEGASHWIPLDSADQVNDLLLEFLASEQEPAKVPARRRRL